MIRSSFVAPLIVSITLAFGACDENTSPPAATPKEVSEQDLKITYGGFMHDGPEDQLLDGVCGTDTTRNTVNCDVHNGLMGWSVTEITFQVIRTGDDQQHYYRERVSIAPLQTQHVTLNLGMQLPADTYIKYHGKAGGQTMTHWSWLILQAKGTPSKL